MATAAFACFQSTVGLILPFVLVDPPVSAGMQSIPISNAESAVPTWINQQGKRRVLVYSNAESAVFTYTLSMADTRNPHLELGWLEVSFGTTVITTSSFVFHVAAHV